VTKLVKLSVGDVGRVPARNRKPVQEWSWQWSDGGPAGLVAGCPSEADLALSISPEDALAVKDGRLAPSVAFMQGRLKTAGDNALLLDVLRWTTTPEFMSALEAASASYTTASGPG
jgi:hypothetical protein